MEGCVAGWNREGLIFGSRAAILTPREREGLRERESNSTPRQISSQLRHSRLRTAFPANLSIRVQNPASRLAR